MIEFDKVAKSFQKTPILADVSFRVERGEVLAILGPSGIGKTTTLRLAAGTERADSGQVRREGERIGYIFQEPRLLPWRTALGNILFVLQDQGLSAAQQKEMAVAILTRLGLGDHLNYYPAQLSGGMRQRVSIARAFVMHPDLALLDEPFTGLDLALKSSLQQMLSELLAWHPCAMIYVTHDPQDAVLLADRAIVLYGSPARVTAQIELTRPRSQRDLEYLQAQAAHLTALLL